MSAVDAKTFILAQPSAEDRAFEKAKEVLDGMANTALQPLNTDNIPLYCENITEQIVYDFLLQVEDEAFWNTIFNSLLSYASERYSSPVAA